MTIRSESAAAELAEFLSQASSQTWNQTRLAGRSLLKASNCLKKVPSFCQFKTVPLE
jgi:hypothetical protein